MSERNAKKNCIFEYCALYVSCIVTSIMHPVLIVIFMKVIKIEGALQNIGNNKKILLYISIKLFILIHGNIK